MTLLNIILKQLEVLQSINRHTRADIELLNQLRIIRDNKSEESVSDAESEIDQMYMRLLHSFIDNGETLSEAERLAKKANRHLHDAFKVIFE